jgi:hypothetical protein
LLRFCLPLIDAYFSSLGKQKKIAPGTIVWKTVALPRDLRWLFVWGKNSERGERRSVHFFVLEINSSEIRAKRLAYIQ